MVDSTNDWASAGSSASPHRATPGINVEDIPIVGVILLVWLYLRSEYAWLVAVAFVVILWGVYPIMLQRYNRARIWRIRSAMLRMQKAG